jgi:hypothetical protein
MDESFEIPVHYKGRQLFFKGNFLILPSSYKIQVHVNGIDLIYEPDPKGNWRLLMDPYHLDKTSKPDMGLLREIGRSLKSLTQ